MSLAESIGSSPASGPRRGLLDLAWLAVLIAEVLSLSFSFDVAIPAGRAEGRGAIVWLVAHSSALIRAAACMASVLAAAFLATARRGGPARRSTGSPSSAWWTSGHLAAFAAFYAATGRLVAAMNGGGDVAPVALVWAAAGAATLAAWMLAARPAGAWLRLARGSWKVLAVALVAGCGAVWAGGLTGRLWASLHSGTFAAAAWILSRIEPDVLCDPAARELGAGGFSVTIAPVCSGYEGIGLILALLSGYLIVCRDELKFPQALVLLPAGAALIASLNVLRIVALVLIGAHGRPRVAVGGFHSQAGWLAFNLVGLGLIAGSRGLGAFSKARSDAEDSGPTVNPTAAYLGPLMALLAVAMVTGAASDGAFDLLYPARIAAACAVLWVYRGAYPIRSWAAGLAPASAATPIAIGVAAYLIWVALEPAPEVAAGGTARGLAIPAALAAMGPAAAAAWLSARVLGSVAVVPLAEELAFRGYLQRRLVDADFEAASPREFTWLSFLGPSLAFGLMHQRWIAGTAAGMLYAAAALRRGRLGDAVLAHAATNALIAARVLAGGAWWLWA
ncbi:Transmembrane exosortase (Exosortase_EpsH) [Aquisphaera giovannonii]|uniref:Transmembrane exosortase (Exosortase_EpsH) n=1 Tax=Aquisphaera giovannonii TaxID=406548 RepID=A0A5B9WFV8_9BACT|nr:exosortase E/protease, VPEID-CTERM system [Aquisphaera giovannonii]QEH38895.1 Transmembrane exosortase (Exosortase_EpsH) [Aquisphaera giovannonii]